MPTLILEDMFSPGEETRHCQSIEVEKTCSFDWQALRETLQRFEDAARLVGVPESHLDSFSLALWEALLNAAKHGSAAEGNHIQLKYGVEPEYLWARVRHDEGGFDPSKVSAPLSSSGLGRPSGRGVFLMRNLCDVVEWRRGGTEIFLFKSCD